MDVLTHHSTTLSISCNYENMGLFCKTRIVLQSASEQGTINQDTARRGKHDRNGRITHTGGGCKETQDIEVHCAAVYRHRPNRGHQSWETVAGENVSFRPLHRSKHQTRKQQQQIKKAGTHQQLNNVTAAQVLQVVFQATSSTLVSPRRSILILPDLWSQVKSSNQAGGCGWRCIYE